MANAKRILLAVDGAEASQKVTRYVADLMAGANGLEVQMLHLELPPRMLEWGGSEDPQIEDEVSRERADAYHQLEERRELKGQAVMDRMQSILTRRGIAVTGRFVEFQEPLDADTITKAILDAAKEHHCGTVVVGRKSFSGWQRLFRKQVAEELVRDGEGIAVWVVE
ncbi:MAG TPA: universal stress protein [Gemmataceae bacterium]|nr:universal stress protein [Gemmataceae bacterium]